MSHCYLRSGAVFERLAGVVGFVLVERKVTLVDSRQPFDQAFRKSVPVINHHGAGWQGLRLLRMGYIISQEAIFLWVRVVEKDLTYALICHNCTSFTK